MLSTAHIALKEWAIVTSSLVRGEQILLLRKGGIQEKRGDFEVEHREFLLFPTYVHQKAEDLVPEVREAFAAVAAARPVDGTVSLGCYAVVEEVIRVTDLAPLRELAREHVLSWSAVEQRFWYKNRPGLHVLLLRAYRLPVPHVIPNTPRYEGCVSWVELDHPLSTAGARPALSDTDFTRRAEQVRQVLAAFLPS